MASLFKKSVAAVMGLRAVWKSKFYGAFVLNRRVVLHAIDAPPARWRGDAGSSPLDRARTAASLPRNDLVKNCRVHPTHWLIFTQVKGEAGKEAPPGQRLRGRFKSSRRRGSEPRRRSAQPLITSHVLLHQLVAQHVS